MSKTVAEMTAEELAELIDGVVETKLLELFGDPDEGLELRDEFRLRLERQQQAVAAGDRGEPFEDVVRRLGLT